MPLMTIGSLYFFLHLVDLRPVERLLVARGVGVARRRGVIALGDVALAAAVVVGVDGEAERAETRFHRAIEDRLDPGLVAAHVELEYFQAVRHDLAGLLDVGLGHRALEHRAAERAGGIGDGGARRRIETLDAADRRQRHRHGDLAAEEFRAGVGAVDVAQNARAKRQRVEREAVASHGGLGLGAADQVVPDVAVEFGARHRHELVQIVELFADVVDTVERLGGGGVVHCDSLSWSACQCRAFTLTWQRVLATGPSKGHAMQQTIGVIGLGLMGEVLAGRLMAAGFRRHGLRHRSGEERAAGGAGRRGRGVASPRLRLAA